MLRIDRFRWAACQIDALADCLDYNELKHALSSLPETLYKTYGRVICSIPPKYKEKMIRILQFLAFSGRPLRIEEAVDALVVDPTREPYIDPKFRMPDPQEISRYCSSLVVVVSTKGYSHDYKCDPNSNYYFEDDEDEHELQGLELQLAHFSVKEYLTSNRLDKDIAESFQEAAAKASIAAVSGVSATFGPKTSNQGYQRDLSVSQVFGKILDG